ncbi:MAG: flagellar export protein FliJ [Candidatus Gastranaerophilaceae bacterium]
MKKYSFRLQPVLEIREKALEDKRLEMAKVLKLLNDYENELKTLEEKTVNYNVELEGISNSNDYINVADIAGYNNYLVDIEQKIKNQKFLIENTKKVLREKQSEVNEALKEVKVLEKLKETQSQKFYKAIEKKEAEEIDDIITARYKFQTA